MKVRLGLKVCQLAVISVVMLGCDSGRAQPTRPRKEQVQMNDVEVVAGECIGAIRLGMPTSQLPSGVAITAGVAGEFEGIHFLLANSLVSEVWIEDLRTFARPVRYNGHVLAKDASVETLRTVFGPCTRASGIIGGTRYECSSGIVLGFDFKESGEFVQIRVRGKG